MVTLSPIDTERFGIRVARAPRFDEFSLTTILEYCIREHVQLLIARCRSVDTAAAQAMEDAGGRVMDVLVYYERNLAGSPPGTHPGRTRDARHDDAESVRGIAAEAFGGYLGHYHADPRLDPSLCDEAYASWAERSCTDPALADRVLVAEHAGEVAGFLTLKRRGRREQEIVLNAVKPKHQGLGLYGGLVSDAMRVALAEGAEVLSVSTQIGNVRVQRAWCRAGFLPRDSCFTFHLWHDQLLLRGTPHGKGSK